MEEKVIAELTSAAVAKLKASDDNKDGKYNFLSDSGEKVEIIYDFGNSTDESIVFFGDAVCLSLIKGHTKFTLQGKMRSMLAAGKSADEIQAALYNLDTGEHIWKPGLAPSRMTPAEKEAKRVGKMDEAAQEAYIEELKKQLAAQGVQL